MAHGDDETRGHKRYSGSVSQAEADKQAQDAAKDAERDLTLKQCLAQQQKTDNVLENFQKTLVQVNLDLTEGKGVMALIRREIKEGIKTSEAAIKVADAATLTANAATANAEANTQAMLLHIQNHPSTSKGALDKKDDNMLKTIFVNAASTLIATSLMGGIGAALYFSLG